MVAARPARRLLLSGASYSSSSCITNSRCAMAVTFQNEELSLTHGPIIDENPNISFKGDEGYFPVALPKNQKATN